MQAKTKTKPYEYFDPVFEGKHEVPIDTDYNLPDYCPDVQRILKSRIVPEISSYVVSDDAIICDGICDIRILYLDGSGEGIKCCDFTKEFSTSISIKSADSKAVASIRAMVEHMTCRAVSARKIDLHISLSLEIFAVVQKCENITMEIEDDMIEKKVETIETAQAVNAVFHQFSVEEYIPLKSGKPPIEQILRRDICCRINQTSVRDGVLEVDGTADVTFLYSSYLDGVTCERMATAINFNQSIECAGLTDACICDVRITCGEGSVQPKEDSMGECTGVTVYAKMFLTVFIYETCEFDIIDDAYSVAQPVELNYAQSNFMQIQGMREETIKSKYAMEVSGEEIGSIIDIWNEQAEVSAYVDKGEMNLRIRHNICLLYLNAQGRVMYAEKTFDSTHSTDAMEEKVKKCSVYFTAELWEYRITDKNTVEVLMETSIKAMLYSRFTTKQLTSVTRDESAVLEKSQSKLLIYYASCGERLWDIAKSHKALMTDIRSQNELVEDVITETGPIIICNR